MRLVQLFLACSLVACADDPTDADTSEDPATDTSEDSATDTSEDSATDTSEAGDTDPEVDTEPAPANLAAEGTWTLAAAGSTCNMSFGGTWTGVASTTDDYGFTLTYPTEGRELRCLLRSVDTTQFTCGDFVQGGMISSCNVSMAITSVGGTIIGDAAELYATVQVTSSNCGAALNCGPIGHVASGDIE